MKVIDAGLGCRIIEPQVFGDERGNFFESWNKSRWAAEHGLDFDFVQSNVSRSERGVLRGLHYQWPQAQGKLVMVLEGEVHDVAVDVRRGSPTFGQSASVVLGADNRRLFWIPEGFAHGFVVLSERAVFHYLCTAPYKREDDAGIRWNDARLAIDWPVSEPLLSGKDAGLPFLDEIAAERLPEVRA
ncbi:MAG: dTDP-4-dehydrorhamnose 3,5-epimerase [Arenimonas sp.]